MRAALSIRRGLSLLPLALAWAAPSLALTELSGSPPWSMSIDGETYQFADALGDSVAYEGTSTVLSIDCDNCTLDARNFLVTRASGSNELIESTGTGWRVNQFRSANHRLELAGGGIFDRCEFRIRTGGTNSLAIISGASGLDFWSTKFLSVSTSDLVTIATSNDVNFENCLFVSVGSGAEAVNINSDGDFSLIGCTLANYATQECVQTAQSSGALAFYNNVLVTATSLPFNATNAAWTGLADSHNWYFRGNGGTLATYGGTNYTDAETFEPNSRDGDPLLVDDNGTTNGNYSVNSGSGPVDLGDSARNTLTLDIVGAPRERGSSIDMGAYEYQPSDQGSCCFSDGSCVVTTESLCLEQSGDWTEGGVCDPNNCDQPGACCAGEVCTIELNADCSGTFLGEGTTCDPGVCVFGCPPTGYTEIESLPIQIGVNGSKWALCQDFTVTSLEPWGSNDWAVIDVAASNVSITGMGYTITLDPTLDTSAMDRVHGIIQTGTRDGITVRDLTLDWETEQDADQAFLSQGIFTLRNVTITSNHGGIYAEPKAADEFNGSVIDSCTVTITEGPQCATIGTGGGTLTSTGFTLTNSSFYALDPNAYDCDEKNFRILFVHDGYIDNCNFVTYKAGPYPDSYYIANGGTGCAQDTEPFGFYSCTNWEIANSRIVTFRNPAVGARGNAGYVSIRKDSDASPFGSQDFYIHDCFIWSDYLGINASGLGQHRFVRNRIFGSMNPQNGTTSGEGYTILISSTSDPCASYFESNLIVGREGETFMINNGGGADTLIANTIVNLDEARSDANALLQSQNTLGDCGPLVARNNILVSSSGSAATYRKALVSGLDADLDHNLYWNRGGGPIASWNGTTYTTLAQFQAGSGQEANGLEGDPAFVSSISALSDTLTNFALRATSRAIDAGDSTILFSATDLAGLDRIVGAQIDLGAYEYTDVIPTLQGACCQVDGTCTVTTQADCATLGGTYEGNNTVCSPNPCEVLTQACCFPVGTCLDLEPSDCISQGGFSQGAGSSCAIVNCARPGACCLASGQCFVGSSALCGLFAGVWQGPGTDCDPNPCSQPTGACCTAEVCTIETLGDCGGTYQGNGTTCTPDPCDLPDPTGACCFVGAFCQVLTEEGCDDQGGAYEGDGTGCDPNPCPEATGACCDLADGTCTIETADDCIGGVWWGSETTCAETECPQPTAACCLPELVGPYTCILATEEACLAAEGIWYEGEVCDSGEPCGTLGLLSGGTRIVYGEATWISSGAPTAKHCNASQAKLGASTGSLIEGHVVVRFVAPTLPAGARIIGATIEGTIASTPSGADPEDIEVYQLKRDPVICETSWDEYASGQSWTSGGGLGAPSDRILPALTDQLGGSYALGDTLTLVEGLRAEAFAHHVVESGSGAILVTCESDRAYLDGDAGPEPIRLVIRYAVGTSRRRAVVTGQ